MLSLATWYLSIKLLGKVQSFLIQEPKAIAMAMKTDAATNALFLDLLSIDVKLNHFINILFRARQLTNEV